MLHISLADVYEACYSENGQMRMQFFLHAKALWKKDSKNIWKR